MSKKKQKLDFDYLKRLADEFEEAAKSIDAVPVDKEWTQEELSVLEDLRGAAVQMKFNVEATIEEFEGRNS